MINNVYNIEPPIQEIHPPQKIQPPKQETNSKDNKKGKIKNKVEQVKNSFWLRII